MLGENLKSHLLVTTKIVFSRRYQQRDACYSDRQWIKDRN